MDASRKVIKNAIWLMGEKIINILGLIFVTSFVAKYIGPVDYGRISLATYIFSIIQVISIWGSDTLSTKRISRDSNSGLKMLFSISRLKILIFFIFGLPIVFYFYFFSGFSLFVFSMAVMVSSFFYILDVFMIANDAMYKSKYNVIANVIGLIVTFILRYILVWLDFNVYLLAIPIVTVNLIPFIIRLFLFKKHHKKLPIANSKRARSKYMQYVFYTGFPLVVSSISIAIYLNASRIILGTFESVESLGIYAAAITLGSAWGFVNNSFVVSLTPKLYSSRDDSMAQDISALMSQFIIIATIIYLFFFYFLGRFLIDELYGKAYNGAFPVAMILVFYTCISGLGIPASIYTVYKGGYKFLSIKTMILSFSSIAISYFFIKYLGINGAAYSTIVIELLSLTLLNYFFDKGVIFKIHMKVFDFKIYKKVFGS